MIGNKNTIYQSILDTYLLYVRNFQSVLCVLPHLKPIYVHVFFYTEE